MAIQDPNASTPPYQRASVVARWWAGLVAGASFLLIASYFMPWGHVPSEYGHSDPTIPIQSLFYGPHDSFQFVAVFWLFTGPVMATLSASLALIGPRWSWRVLSLLCLLAGLLSLLVSTFLHMAQALFIGSAYVTDAGAYLGLGTSVLMIIAARGLFSSLSGIASLRRQAYR